MDLICPRCGEPWDMECLHEEAQARYGLPPSAPGFSDEEYGAVYDTVTKEFRRSGCKALATAYGIGSCEPVRSDATAAAQAMYDVLGDDMDGAAAMFEDFGIT